jgi:hypothetical protein
MAKNENKRLIVLYCVDLMSADSNKKGVDCAKCIHFFITWDKNYPKGCRAMGFKCQEMPSDVVFKSSGIECLRFERKKASGKRQ